MMFCTFDIDNFLIARNLWYIERTNSMDLHGMTQYIQVIVVTVARMVTFTYKESRADRQ